MGKPQSTRNYNISVKYQNKDLIEAIYNKDLIPAINLNEIKSKNKNKLIVGKKYYIQGTSCDGFDMPTKQYEVVAVINNYKNMGLNYVVVKQIGGEVSTIFELPRNICTELGIEYNERLQLFPITMGWNEVIEDVNDNTVFDPNNLATYPSQYGYVNYIIIKLKGFSSYRPTHIVTSNGTMMNSKDFISSLRIQYLYDIDGEKKNINLNDFVKYEIITNEVANTNISRRGCLCDENGDIFVRLNLVGKNITNNMLEGLTVKDIFRVFWTEEITFDKPQIQSAISIDLANVIDCIGQNIDERLKCIGKDISRKDFAEGMVRFDGTSYEKYTNGRWKRML